MDILTDHWWLAGCADASTIQLSIAANMDKQSKELAMNNTISSCSTNTWRTIYVMVVADGTKKLYLGYT